MQIAEIARIPYYSAEVNDHGNRRAQKFVFKGMSPAPAK